jgi:acyl-CoA dehydrogenase
VLGINLTFNKRYITLAPVATVVGLAFRLYDPDHLLGEKEDIGITCALLPRSTPGLIIGNRHDPMGVPFQNGPVKGKDVFVPLDFIIGGQAYAGQGWRMLMEALAAGRGISLPSLSVGAAELSTRASTAYSAVREQFGLSIGKFEGVRERLTRIAMHTYFMNATRLLTCGAVDAGEHPSVASAIAKAYLTEGMRLTLNDSMDIVAGAAICRGPQNMFSRAYNSIPIGITVEGSNILTRSLIVFGQGAIRCHPFLQAEIEAIAKRNVKAFDKAFFGHIGHVAKNAARALLLGLTGGALANAPAKTRHAKYYRKLSRYSAAFSLIADVGLITLGGNLKRKEYLSGRYADAMAWLYLASATLKHAHQTGYPESANALVELTLQHALLEIEKALLVVLSNLPNRFIAGLAYVLAFPYGPRRKAPKDQLADKVADLLLDETSGLRQLLTSDIHVPHKPEPGLGLLEEAYRVSLAAQPARKKIIQAVKTGAMKKASSESLLKNAKHQKIITDAEVKIIEKAEELKNQAIQVDFFTPQNYQELK